MDSAILDTASDRYLGEWKRLVSTTNWDKGRIIYALAHCPGRPEVPSPPDYCDDAWSRQSRQRYSRSTSDACAACTGILATCANRTPGLYWSHFQAVLDWNDAEMWLEGAVQMAGRSPRCAHRADALGQSSRVVGCGRCTGGLGRRRRADNADGEIDAVTGKRRARCGRQLSKSAQSPGDDWSTSRDVAEEDDQHAASRCPSLAAEPVRPFANLASLPADVSEAFESFKLSILKHKLAGWAEIARDDLVGVSTRSKNWLSAH